MAHTIIALQVTPKSSRNEIIGWVSDAAGQPVLKIKINATPEDGKANKALIAFLAREWGVPAATLEVVSGESSRHKRLNVNSEVIFRQVHEHYPRK